MSAPNSVKGDFSALGAMSARRFNRQINQVSTAQTLGARSEAELVFNGLAGPVSQNLPESGLIAGWAILVDNLDGAESVTVQIGAGTLKVVEPGRRVEFVAKVAAPSAVANWIVRDVAADANDIAYVNSTSGLTATNVQDAIDEVEGRLDTAEGDIVTNAGNISSNLAAIQANDGDITDIRSAIGIADGDTNLGDFATNNVLADNSTVKAALEALDAGSIHANGSVAFTADQSMGGFKLTNVGTPTADGDAANKLYVDNAIAGVVSGTDWQDSIRGTSSSFEFASPAAAVAGISAPQVGDRVINSVDGGIYELTNVGSGTEAWSLAAAAAKGFAASLDDEQNAVALYTGSAWTIVRWERTAAGLGLEMNADGFTVDLSSTVAGAGISYSAGVLSIAVGNGLNIDGSEIIQLVLKDTTLAKDGSGLFVNIADSSLEDVSGLKVKLDPAGAIGLDAGSAGLEVLTGVGIEISSNALRIASDAAGDGLGYSAGVLSVNVGDGIALSGDAVVVDLVAANSGLEFSGGKLQIQRDYDQSFNATTDWGTASGGYYTITVAVGTHAQGVTPKVSLFELVDTDDFVSVAAEETRVDELGNVSFKVPEDIDARFAGKVKISHSYVS